MFQETDMLNLDQNNSDKWLVLMFSCRTEKTLRPSEIEQKPGSDRLEITVWSWALLFLSQYSEAVTKTQISYRHEKTVAPSGHYSPHSCWDSLLRVEYMDSPGLSLGQGLALSARDVAMITKFSFCKIIAIIVISVSQRELQ